MAGTKEDGAGQVAVSSRLTPIQLVNASLQAYEQMTPEHIAVFRLMLRRLELHPENATNQEAGEEQ